MFCFTLVIFFVYMFKQSNKPRCGLGNYDAYFIVILTICYGDCIIKNDLLTYLRT